MPRFLRSPGSKSFRLENVSVPNASRGDASGASVRGGLGRGPLWVRSRPGRADSGSDHVRHAADSETKFRALAARDFCVGRPTRSFEMPFSRGVFRTLAHST